jgi:hypothetical protein
VDPVLTLTALAAQARDAERAHSGRLVALLVGVPSGIDAALAERTLRTALARSNGTAVDVRAEPRMGPARILRMEFTR